MHPKKLANVTSMSADDRYWYFVRKVADFEEVWLLEMGGHPLTIDMAAGNSVYPVWPEWEFAEAAARERECWGPTRAMARPLDEIMERWLPGMHQNGEKVGVFWAGPDLVGIDVEPLVLLEDLREECAQYE